MRLLVGITAVAALIAALLLTGCSPTGWAAKELPDCSNIAPGNAVTVVQKDGKKVSGAYRGTIDIPAAEYSSEYNGNIEANGLVGMLPYIGERIELTTNISEARVWSGTLVGFDLEHLYLQAPSEQEPREFYIASIARIWRSAAPPLERMQFRSLFLNGDIPLRSALVVDNGAREVSIPLNTVAGIIEEPALAKPASVVSVNTPR